MSPNLEMMEKEPRENDACLDDGDNKPRVQPARSRLQYLKSNFGFTRNTLILLGLLLFLILVLLIVVIVLAVVPCGDGRLSDRPLCDTPDCYRTSALVLEQVNTSADPCSDFYEFACGGWLRDHPIPGQYGDVTVTNGARRQFARQCREIVETMAYTENFRSLQWKVKAFYHSCMDLDSVDSAGDAMLKRSIEHLKGWKPIGTLIVGNWDWSKVLRELHVEYGVFPFFRISVRPDDINPIQNVIQISPSGLGLPHLSYYFRSPDDKVVKAYRQLMKDLAQLLGATNQRAVTFADEVFHFEKRIAETILNQEETNANDKKKITVRELLQISQRISWIDHLKSFLPQAYISENTPIYTPSRRYLTDVSTILSTTDNGSLNSYLIWTLVFKYAPYLSKPYRNAFEPYLRVYSGAFERKPRWEFCIETTNKVFNLALLSLYVRESVQEEAFIEAYEIFKSVRSAFTDNLRNVDWMDSAIRHIAINKIKNITPMVAYGDFVLDDSILDNYYDKLMVLKTDFFQNIQNGALFRRTQLESAIKNSSRQRPEFNMLSDLNVYYSELNEIVIPPIYLQEPLFHSSYPKYLMFGTLGSYIGHGLIQGFEEVGKSFDRSGYTPIWWSNRTMVTFAEHKDCLSKHYSEFSVDDNRINGNQSLVNNIADIGGVIQAFYAFRTWEYTKGSEPVLPGVTYTPDQLFFISYAQSLCSANREEYLENFLKLSSYPPGKVRVTGTLSQVPQFADAFQCSRGALLNPNRRCRLW